MRRMWLEQAERFMMEVLKLPEARTRLEALVFMIEFSSSRASELRSDLQLIEAGCDDVKGSLELRKLLKVGSLSYDIPCLAQARAEPPLTRLRCV